MPAATAAALLVATLALGATAVGPLVLTAATDPTCQDEQGNVIPCDPPPGGGPTATPGDPAPTPGQPTATPGDPAPTPGGAGEEPTPTDKPGSGDKPDPKPDPTHKPKPHPELLGLRLSNVDGGIKVDWTACHRRGFDAYKVVRSTDASVSWPLGENDSLVRVVHNRYRTAMVDSDAPVGAKVWYRVFCVNKTADGYKVLGATRAKSIVRHETPEPKPCDMGLEANATDGGVVLDWGACSSDAFHWYKVVRSHGENPSYLPWTDGSQLIGIIENPGTTHFTDTKVESGQTWFYRIQAVGYSRGQEGPARPDRGDRGHDPVTAQPPPMVRWSGPWSRRRQYGRTMAARSAPLHRPSRDGS